MCFSKEETLNQHVHSKNTDCTSLFWHDGVDKNVYYLLGEFDLEQRLLKYDIKMEKGFDTLLQLFIIFRI